MLRIDDYIKAQLVTVGWRYGNKYGGHLAACIIMSCLANRVKLGWGSWLEVIDRIPNFAAELDPPTGTPELWNPSFVRMLHEVEAIYDGTQDYAKEGVYWCDLNNVETLFFKEKILGELGRHPRAVDMNTLAVFK